MIRGVTKTEGSVTVFHLKDDLDTDKVKAFIKKIQDLIDSGRSNIIVDMSSCHYICVLGLVSISSIFNKCRQSGGALKIAALTPEVRDAFRETNLINTIEVYDTPLEALKSYQSDNLLKAKAYSGSFYIEEDNAFVPWDRLPVRSYYN